MKEHIQKKIDELFDISQGASEKHLRENSESEGSLFREEAKKLIENKLFSMLLTCLSEKESPGGMEKNMANFDDVSEYLRFWITSAYYKPVDYLWSLTDKEKEGSQDGNK